MQNKRLLLGIILLWLTLGLLLEFLLGIKANAYLNDPIRREMWRLAHAHGVLLCLVYLVFDHHWGFVKTLDRRVAFTGMLLMPIGFLLGGMSTTETDPFIGVLLAPLGGLLFIGGLAATLLFQPKAP